MAWPKKNLWEYQTKPQHLFDYTMWFILRPLMLWKAHGKISHWWHWKKLKITNDKLQNLKGGILKADPTHSFHKKSQLDQIRMSLGGWKSAYIVETKEPNKKWQRAYQDPNSKQIFKCAIVFEGPIRALRGPDDVREFGFDLSGEEIPILIHSPHQRHDKNYRRYPIV